MNSMAMMQAINQLRRNPIQTLRQMGVNVPDNLTDPNAIIQHLMDSGQVTQQQYDRARQMASQFKR